MVNLYNLYKSSPETYQLLLEEKVKEMYSGHDIALLEESYNDLIKHKRIITANRPLHRITEDEKENLLNEIIFRIPSINEKYLNVFRLKRAGDNETACLQQCQDNYTWELIGIASEAGCVGGIAFISACVSLGSLTIPAIIALIVEYAKMDYALATAERIYNQCCTAC